MNVAQAKLIPLANILAGCGHQPHHQRGHELWYRSPFRDEREPSFHINTTKNIWYDFGSNQGGTAIDFAMAYWRTMSVSEALRQLRGVNTNEPIDVDRVVQSRSADTDYFEVRELQHPVLRSYLADRAIPITIARHHLKEIHWGNSSKPYYGLAFPNNSGGYEVRNKYYKGIQGGRKDISTIGAPTLINKSVAIFEGFMDFLSYLAHRGDASSATSTVIVMNSTTMQDKAIAAIQSLGIDTVHLYLDRDTGGRAATQKFQQALPGITVEDMSILYADIEGIADFNDWLVSQRNRQRGV